MKSAALIFAALIGIATANDGKSLLEQEEGRDFGVSLLAILGTLIQLGVSIVILIALINLVATLKDVVDLDSLFGKGGDEYYDTGYGAPPLTGYGAPTGHTGGSDGSSYSSYRRQGGVARSINDLPAMSRLSAKVNEAIENFTE